LYQIQLANALGDLVVISSLRVDVAAAELLFADHVAGAAAGVGGVVHVLPEGKILLVRFTLHLAEEVRVAGAPRARYQHPVRCAATQLVGAVETVNKEN